jgi:hypothetical protein
VPSALATFASLRAVVARGGTQWQEQDFFLGGPAELEAQPCPSSTNTWTWVYTACDQGGARCHPPAARSAPADCSPATAPPTNTHAPSASSRQSAACTCFASACGNHAPASAVCRRVLPPCSHPVARTNAGSLRATLKESTQLAVLHCTLHTTKHTNGICMLPAGQQPVSRKLTSRVG